MSAPALTSVALTRALSVALAGGNAVVEVSEGWSVAKRVVHMRRPMSAGYAQMFRQEAGLDYYAAPAAPHWPGDEGFADPVTGEALSFPLSGRRAGK